MRDTLPHTPWKTERGIINLDTKDSGGTHWIAYYKRNRVVKYFDSFGDLRPPIEVINYFKDCTVVYNKSALQTFNTNNCGHLCLAFLLEN